MTRKRLLSADRRASILEAATKVFAEYGRSGAKTQRIAAEAKVSEALIFRHFPSKDVLYCAVLRKMIKDQNDAFKTVGSFTPDTAGLVNMMVSYFGACIRGHGMPNSDSIRVLYASLAGDGNFARLTYRRALRLSLAPLQAALDNARAAGDLVGDPIDAVNMVALIEHLGSNVCVARLRETPLVRYAGTDDELLRQMILFCGRGMGLTEQAINRHLAAGTAAARPPDPPPEQPQPDRPVRKRKPRATAE